MANKLDSIIDISISLSTKTIATQGFGVPVIAGECMKLDRRAKSYANITEVADDFAEGDTEYKMAAIEFSQEKTPSDILTKLYHNYSSKRFSLTARFDGHKEKMKRCNCKKLTGLKGYY